MTRKQFLKDRQQAAENRSIASIHDITLGADADQISFLYSNVALDQAILVHANVSGMPP